MGTFFGEIVEPQSRAFWDEDDASNESYLDISYEDNKLKDSSDAVDLFIFVQGYLAEAFARRYMLQNQSASIKIFEKTKCSLEDNVYKRKHEEQVCEIYKLSEKVLLCISKHRFNLRHAFSFTEKIADLLKRSKQVTILTSLSVAGFFYPSERGNLHTPFLRQLHTDNFNGPNLCPHLEQPNIVAELSAQVLMYCQSFQIRGVMYVCYSDTYNMDSITAKPFLQIMSHYPLTLHRAGTHDVSKSEVPDSLYM